MAKGDDIQERLIDFAVEIVKFCSLLSNNSGERHVAGQLLRSGTSPAPNYAEARGAESTKDFLHKLGVVLKELNESEVWLLLIMKSNMISGKQIESILKECNELCQIINASIKTFLKKNR